MSVSAFSQSRFQHRDMSGINVTPLALEASEVADYGLFAQVLADARNAGFADVALRQ